MGAFGGLILTNKGRALQAKANTGVQLVFTRIGIGDGSLSGQSIPTLTALISEKKSLAITKLKTQAGGKAVIGTVLSNQDVVTGFYFREIGVFATDPNEGEILYCYGNAGTGAEYIPPGGGPDIVEKNIDIIALIDQASNVSATIDESLVFETPDGAQAKADAAETDAKSYADGLVGLLSSLTTTQKANLVAAINELQAETDAAAATADAALPKAGGTMTGPLQLAGGNARVDGSSSDFITVSSRNSAHLATNAYLDSSGNWQRYDTTKTSALVYVERDSKKIRFASAEPAANPITNWVFADVITSAGGTMTGEITFQDDNEGVSFYGGAKIYKKAGTGLVLRRQNGDSDPEVENYAGTSRWKIWHSGNDGAGSGLDADTVRGFGGISNAAGDGSLRVTNQYGYIDVGPKNTSFCHLYTDIAGGFYFNKTDIYANGNMVWHDGRLRWNSGRLEYNDGGTWKAVGGVKSVQRGIVNLPATSGTITNVTISAVDITKAFVNISSFSDTNGGRFFVKLTSSTNLEFQSWIGSGLSGLPWEVVEHY